MIAVRAPDGVEVARGLANYAAGETRLIARKPSSQIEAMLGYANEPELIHRDNLVLRLGRADSRTACVVRRRGRRLGGCGRGPHGDACASTTVSCWSIARCRRMPARR